MFDKDREVDQTVHANDEHSEEGEESRRIHETMYSDRHQAYDISESDQQDSDAALELSVSH